MTLTEIHQQNLRGHDYIKARGLTRRVKLKDEKHDPIQPASHPDCEVCNQAELLEKVVRILEKWT